MPAGFMNVNMHRDNPQSVSGLEGIPGLEGTRDLPMGLPEEQVSFSNDEAAARYYLGQVFGRSPLESISNLTAPRDPGVVPDLQLQQVRDQPLTNTRTLHFQQTRASIPVFGSSAVVELGPDRSLVSIDAEMGEMPDISPIASLSPVQALRRIATYTHTAKSKLKSVQAPELTFFYKEDDDTWHLAYFFQDVPAAPKAYIEELQGDDYRGHGLMNHLRTTDIAMNYLVDAHDGEILFYYSANPMATALLVPSKAMGLDEDDMPQNFFCRLVASGFEMYDPLRGIRTFNMNFADLTTQTLPNDPVVHTSADFAATNRAAVAAHANATRVYDFYKSEVKRDSIDDKGMELISYINCTYSRDQAPPEWFNAVWYRERMWYGQVRDGNGTLRSFSRFLDVIAHELTHGVTQYTADLVYRNQSGALNESISDIFGVIIKNWSQDSRYKPVSQWSWEMGPGLGGNGLPLRDLSDPTRTNDPDHMRDYLRTFRDNGGVHTNSNIHNKAAYNVFTAVDANGQFIFADPGEVAILYYLALTRLSRLADFSKIRQALIDVARTFYAGNPAERDLKIQTIRAAYDVVGIF